MKEVDQGSYQPWKSNTQSITFTTNNTAWTQGWLAVMTDAGGVIINFTEDIKYQLIGCTSYIPFSPDTLPAETLKTWTYTTYVYPKRVVLYCNGVQVFNEVLSDSKCDDNGYWRNSWLGMPSKMKLFSVADVGIGSYCIFDYTGKYRGEFREV